MVGKQQHAPAPLGPVGGRSRRLLPWIILTVGLSLSVIAYYLVRDWEEAIIRADFEFLASTHGASLHRELSRHLDASTALVGLFDASEEVDRDEFHRFVKGLLSQHGDISNIMWVPRVTAAELPEFVRRAHADGIANFRVTDAGGAATTAPVQGAHFPIYYLEPLTNEDLLGVDVATVAAYRGVLDDARDSGNVAVSPPIQISAPANDGVWLARAVYKNRTNLGDVEQRRESLQGFVIQALRMKDFVDESFVAALDLDTQIIYHRNGQPPQVVYEHASERSWSASGSIAALMRADLPLVWRADLHTSNPYWEMILSPAPRFWESHPIWRSWTVSAVGVVLSGFLWLYMFGLARQTSRAESLARNLIRSNSKLEKEIMERVRIEKQAGKLSRAIEQTADAVMITDRNGLIEYINPAFEKMTGFSPSETLGKKSSLVKSGRHDAEFYSRLWKTIIDGDVFQDVLINRKKNGALYYEEKTITPLKDMAGNITHFIGTGKDITDRMQTQERLHYLAYHDVLTELPNRLLFLERLTHALKARQGQHRRLAVVFLDLDRFKVINDTMGPQIGDALLRKIAAVLPSCVGRSDTIARLGGDEFGILLEDMASLDAVTALATKLLNIFLQPFRVGDHEFYINTSIGVSVYPEDGADADSLLKNADVAMYRAKDQGGNNYQFYSSDMSVKAFERLSLGTSLRRALERDEFVLYFQPQCELASGKIIAVEALLRWQHPDLGLVSPLDFIPLLEETGLILPVGSWVIEQACKWAAPWQQYGPLRISVNLSGRQFRDVMLSEQVVRILERSELAPELLELEITESVLMQGDNASSNNIAALDDAGIRFAIDDFGTGYSSLSYLKRFPIKTLKIDRAFIRDVKTNHDDAAIVTAIIAMARSLDLDVVAEGVETDEQLDFLRTGNCDLVQGYLISRPLPANEMDAFLAHHRRTLEIA